MTPGISGRDRDDLFRSLGNLEKAVEDMQGALHNFLDKKYERDMNNLWNGIKENRDFVIKNTECIKNIKNQNFKAGLKGQAIPSIPGVIAFLDLLIRSILTWIKGH